MKRNSMQCKIPEDIRERLENDSFMSKCCVASEYCKGVIQWHHALIFAGKRINEWWCLLPLCEYHHYHEATLKHALNEIMVSRASDEELLPYSKCIDYIKLKHAQSTN